MIRPRIGITCDLNQREFPEEPVERDRHTLMDAYVLAITKAGGIPILLPSLEDESEALALIDVFDALVISGGGHDIDPELFGERRKPGKAKVRAFNPKIENNGWNSGHTIVEIVNTYY